MALFVNLGFLAGLAVLDYNDYIIRPTMCGQLIAP